MTGMTIGSKKLLFGLGVTFLIVSSILVLRSARTYALDENKCLSCHGNPSFSKIGPDGQKISLYVNEEAVNTAAHRYIDCTTCHTDQATVPHKVITPLTKLSLAQKCGTCHQYEYKVHLDSVHGKQLAQGNPDVATCTDCHSATGNPHSVIRVLEYNSPAFKKSIADTCAKCHSNEELMADYGKVEDVYETYMRSFHGKATLLANKELDQLNKATCTSCHGVHDIKSPSDPVSSVGGMENLAKTCEKCHPGAGVQFASGFLGHKEASPQNVAPVFYTERLFTTLLTVVVTGGALVVALAVIRYSANRWKR